MTQSHRFAFTAMGSECVLHLSAADIAIAEAAEAEIVRIEHHYSRYRADSLLAEINRVAAGGGSIAVDDETAALLDYAFACHRKSGGLFDITTGILRQAWNFSSGRVPAAAKINRCLPSVGLEKVSWQRPVLAFPTAGIELDFGGIGKEYAADRAAAVCTEAGVAHGLIDLGGDIRVIGPRPDGSPWPIHIRNPRAFGNSLACIELEAGGLATSGDYERCIAIGGRRYSHILNPRTGWPVNGLASVSVIADSCLVAGSVATIAMLKGPQGGPWLDSLGVRCVWIDHEGRTGGSGMARPRTASLSAA
jgi:thiamine biosynthesis lipoprotein